jgi:cell division protein FtsI/penicillin-binding protein 2
MTRRGFLAVAAAGRCESIARLIRRELPDTEYLLARAGDGSVVAERWNSVNTPAPLGSLVKPFVALAYGEAHAFEYPRFECTGCWLPQGHGFLDLRTALAQSCNSYFLHLAAAIAPGNIELVAQRYGLTMPDDTSPASLIGKWRAKPISTVRAYDELVYRRAEPGPSLVFDAMRLCARSGTAAGLGAPAAAKTGTAPCVHQPKQQGDGLVAVLFPEASPEFVLLARTHGVTGAACARRVGPFLRAVLK